MWKFPEFQRQLKGLCHKEPGNNPKVRIVLEYHVIDKLYRHKVGCSGFPAIHQLNYVYVLCRLFHPTSQPISNWFQLFLHRQQALRTQRYSNKSVWKDCQKYAANLLFLDFYLYRPSSPSKFPQPVQAFSLEKAGLNNPKVIKML